MVNLRLQPEDSAASRVGASETALVVGPPRGGSPSLANY